MQYKLRMTPEQVIETAVESVRYAKNIFRLYNGQQKMHVEAIFRFLRRLSNE